MSFANIIAYVIEKTLWSKTLYRLTDVGAGNFLGVQRIFCQNFPKFAEKLLCDKISPYKFSVAVGTFYFPLPSCHRLENGKIYYLKFGS